ncbi:C-C motif chemokine 14-like [Pangasianodon hypophthalmus]|uniref:C-C motif chemokine 14-like n=1 Tax=Pangasianodon hypophthalmus TaxID=310915 RepID=UPI002307E8A8|nr:C-C motif chemokine 14-like [Pangasianodon hypophthalmus]
MKMSRVYLVLGFVLIMELYSDAMPLSLNQPASCCFNFFNGKIPSDKILEVQKTDSRCSQQGFVVTTPRFSKLCARNITVNESDTPVSETVTPTPHSTHTT